MVSEMTDDARKKEWKEADIELSGVLKSYMEEARRHTNIRHALEAYSHALDIVDPRMENNKASQEIIREYRDREACGDLQYMRSPYGNHPDEADRERVQLMETDFIMSRKNPKLASALFAWTMKNRR